MSRVEFERLNHFRINDLVCRLKRNSINELGDREIRASGDQIDLNFDPPKCLEFKMLAYLCRASCRIGRLPSFAEDWLQLFELDATGPIAPSALAIGFGELPLSA